MNYKTTYLHCSETLKNHLEEEINEVFEVISSIEWKPDFVFCKSEQNRLEQNNGTKPINLIECIIRQSMIKLE
jgi:hypothetical protein